MRSHREWSTTAFATFAVAAAVLGWLAGQVAGADQRFEPAVRVAARLLQILIGVAAAWVVFTWAFAHDRRRAEQDGHDDS